METPATEPEPENPTVVIIDDDDIEVKGVTRAIKKLDSKLNVQRARDGLEGLELLHKLEELQRPFIVLLDINMPRMNGLELLHIIRKDESLSDCVVFMLSTSGLKSDKLAAYKFNAAGYVIKTEIEDGYTGLVEMLDQFCRIVKLPNPEDEPPRPPPRRLTRGI